MPAFFDNQESKVSTQTFGIDYYFTPLIIHANFSKPTTETVNCPSHNRPWQFLISNVRDANPDAQVLNFINALEYLSTVLGALDSIKRAGKLAARR